MYKMLLCLRYLRTRYIALASIISVMLGVATMIVVNSVMSGFQSEMYTRLHGILGDVVVESHSMEGIEDPEILKQEIRGLLKDDLQGMTATVHVPAMLSYKVRGQWVTKQLNLIGVDHRSYTQVSDFSKYLTHPTNRRQVGFELRKSGYDARIGEAGWTYRRMRVAQERFYEQQLQRVRERQAEVDRLTQQARDEATRQDTDASNNAWNAVPGKDSSDGESGTVDRSPTTEPDSQPDSAAGLNDLLVETQEDPFAGVEEEVGKTFDPSLEQHTGIVLGIATANIRHRDAAGNVNDVFLCRPGDDVKVTFPTSGTPPQAVSGHFTVVDFYESQMSEYDSSFAFVPIDKLQELRGMGSRVSSIQLKLRPEADLNAVCDRLRERFPATLFPYRIQSWKELQGPLLAAVQMETTILNILLFLIIAVAGFGILATFFMIVVEKTRDIGILKSLGATSRGVMSIFLAYGFSLGCVGSGVGLALGLLFVAYINQIASVLEYVTGREVFDPTIYYFQEIPTIVSSFTLAWIVTGAMLIAVMASVLPALRAARMHPVEALRYE